MILTAILFNIPFVVFFLYAMYACREKRKIAEQPATLAFYVFCGLLAYLVLSILLNLVLGQSTGGREILMRVSPVIAVLHTLLFLSLFVCVFAWRNMPGASYRQPAILAAIAVGLKIAVILSLVLIRHLVFDRGPVQELKTPMYISGMIGTILNFAAYVVLFKAIFAGRGYPETGPDPIAAAMGVKSPAGAAGAAVATGGMFEEKDFIPYLTGVMALGGLIIVPLLWGISQGMDYGDALFPSLLSCGVFAFSHDKRGNFLWGRFIVLSVYVFFTIMKAIAQYGHGGGRQMFLAGGLLGYLVMFACGWGGIALARLVRGRTN